MIFNPFIEQLETEIANNYSLRLVVDTYDHALKLNSYEKDFLVREDKALYINRLLNTYKNEVLK